MADRRALLIGLAVVAAGAAWFTLRPRETATSTAPTIATRAADEQTPPPTRIPPKADAPSTPDRSWTGRVIAAETGAAVADALVRVTRNGEKAKPVETRSGPDGSFRLDDLAFGSSHVEIGPRELAPVEFDVDVVPDMRRDVFVPAGVLLTGVVFDGDRRVAGAVVAREDGVASAPTGSDGAYRLAGVASGDAEGNATLHVTAPGVGTQDVSIRVPLGPNRIEEDLHLERPWRVQGRVLADGKPVAGATVSAGSGRTTTDALGGFTLTTTGPRDSVVFAEGSDARWGTSEKLEFPGDGDVANDVVIQLATPVIVRGFVHDASGGPVSAAKIRLTVSERSFESVSGADGRFETRLPAGRRNAVVSADGFFTLLKSRLGPASDAPVPSSVALDFELKRGGTVVGRVHDRAGTAVAGVEIFWSDYLHEDRGEVTSDEDGRFEIRGLPEDKIGISVARPGYVTNGSLQIDAASGVADLVIDHESVIRGVVLLPDGTTPAKLFRVRLYEEATDDDQPWNGRVWTFRDVQFDGADGRFELRDVEPATIRVEATSGLLVTPRQKGVRTRSDGASIELRLVLAPGARIAGRVTDSARRPIANATVEGGGWLPEEDTCRWDCSARTDADGRFELVGLAEGDYMLRVDVDGDGGAEHAPFMQREIHLKVGAGETATPEVVLYRPGHLAVKVADSDGRAVPDVEIEFVDAAGDVTSGPSAATEDVAPGKYVVRVLAEGFEDADTPVEVEEEKTATVSIVLKRK